MNVRPCNTRTWRVPTSRLPAPALAMTLGYPPPTPANRRRRRPADRVTAITRGGSRTRAAGPYEQGHAGRRPDGAEHDGEPERVVAGQRGGVVGGAAVTEDQGKRDNRHGRTRDQRGLDDRPVSGGYQSVHQHGREDDGGQQGTVVQRQDGGEEAQVPPAHD